MGEVRFEVVADGSAALAAGIEVRPGKLDYRTHFRAMQAEIEAICRALLYRTPGVVRARRSATASDGPSIAEYLSLIEALFADLARNVEAILRAPRLRLVRRDRVVDVSRARGGSAGSAAWVVRTPSVWGPAKAATVPLLPLPGRRISYRAVREAVPETDANIPENRLLFHVLTTLRRRLRRLVGMPEHREFEDSSQGRMCVLLLRRVEGWLRSPLFSALSSSFFAPDAEPMMLDPRYLRVQRIHRDLLRGLGDLKGRPFEVSLRDTPELYEYWVYLKLVAVFRSLGFAPVDPFPAGSLSEDALTVALGRGLDFAVRLASPDGQRATLFYNRTFTTRRRASLTHDMRPDAICEVETPSGRRMWAFDAKYRRILDGGCWSPTQEDIDQMHTYRDGIGRLREDGRFERLLDGAFVLFPAAWDEAYLKHRFHRSVVHGIGGFPLMPGDERTTGHLRAWVEKKIKL